MSIQEWKITEPYLAVQCQLGEGPHYSEERNELRFLDIYGHRLHIVDLGRGPESLKSIDTTLPIGFTADIEGVDSSEIILTGYKDGITKFNLKTGKHEYLLKYWEAAEVADNVKIMRSNEGAVDKSGRFWISTFVDPTIQQPQEEGILYRLDPGNRLTAVVDKVMIPNGMSWNATDDTMFFTDSPRQDIYAYDYDAVTGNISNKRVFFHVDEPGAFPDGHAMDVQGNIWQACYGGSKVIRISPSGQLTGIIHLPTRNVTCPVFVGTELFITTARDMEPEKYPDSAKNAGNLYRIDVGIHGMPKHKVQMSS